MRFHNTLGDRVEEFTPSDPKDVKMYHCGPTVYGRQHIGNLSMFVFTDILGRTLEYLGYQIRPVINFTDFGHLTGDNEGDADTKVSRARDLSQHSRT
jgi:cysteinyl-tRNA synthetase